MPRGSAVDCLVKALVALQALIDALKSCRDALPFENDEYLDELEDWLQDWTDYREELED